MDAGNQRVCRGGSGAGQPAVAGCGAARTAEHRAAVLVQATLAIAAAIIAEASLSFLGLGQQPPAPSWGSMLNSAQRFLTQAPWLAIFPGLAIFSGRAFFQF